MSETIARAAWDPAQPPPDELRVTVEVWTRVEAHLREALPNEGCGLLAVDSRRPERVVAFYPGDNVDASPTRYTMSPATVLAAFREMDARGWRLGGIVHAHPVSPATPSSTDLREAFYPSALMVIVSFAQAPPVVRAWAIGQTGAGTVVERALVIDTGDEPPFRARVPTILYASGCLWRRGDVRPGEGERRRLVADGINQNKPRRDRETVLEELQAFPDVFERLVMRSHSREAWLAPAADGGWGVVEILPHLRDWEEIYLDRAEKILREELPRLPAFDDALWAIERDYRAQDPAETLRQFRELRQRFVALLAASSADVWQREGEHSAYGRISLHWLADHICDHDQEHMQQALDALAS